MASIFQRGKQGTWWIKYYVDGQQVYHSLNALRLADEKGLSSVAFPAISTGAFGYPIETAAHVALGAVLEFAPKLANIRRIRFVLLGKSDLEIHEKVLKELL